MTHVHQTPPGDLDRWTAAYSDRACSPALTVRRMRRHFGALGITRLARQTDLDELGIPCFAAIRPNSHTLATNQGKGLDDDAAMASAIMEATEYAVAELPQVPIRIGSARALTAGGESLYLPDQLLPVANRFNDAEDVAWIEGFDLFTGRPVQVPYDLVALTPGAQPLAGIARSTNGLASGNNLTEATFHALCELIERDAATLFSFRSSAKLAQSVLDPAAFGDAVIDALVALIDARGLFVTLFDQTTDIGIPVIHAVIGPKTSDTGTHFEICSGTGCHPNAARAALRAITEAAQSRVTSITGARDDFAPALYREPTDPGLLNYCRMAPGQAGTPRGVAIGMSLEHLLDHVEAKLAEAHIDTVTVVPIGGASYEASVVKVLSRELEDRPANRNWRPGSRALRAMMRLI